MAFDPLSFIIGQQTAKGGGIDTTQIDNLLDEINGEIVGELVLSQGFCGDSAEYILKDSGLLTVFGSGEITSKPWEDVENYKAIIQKVVIEEGITAIALGTFNNYDKLKEATISASVTHIYEFVFNKCDLLTSVVFKNTNNWKCFDSTNLITPIKTFTAAELENPATAATYLKDYYDGYSKYRWIRN